MNLPEEKNVTLDEFYKMREDTTELLEYVDGRVLMSPSPTTKHQRISAHLKAKLFNFLEGSDCEVFSAPYDIQLHREELNDMKKIFIPDLSVICDKKGIGEDRFTGVPKLIIEILSPSNQGHDLVTKMAAYMKYGVEEYWIINPMLNAVQIYELNDTGLYQQTEVVKDKGIARSSVLKGFQVELEAIF